MWNPVPGASHRKFESEYFWKFRSPHFSFEDARWVYRSSGTGAAYAVTAADVYEGAQQIVEMKRQFGWLLGLMMLIGFSLVAVRDMFGGEPMILFAVYYGALFFGGFLVRIFARHSFSRFERGEPVAPPRATGLAAIWLEMTDGFERPSVHMAVVFALILVPIPLLMLLIYLPPWTVFPLGVGIAFLCAYLVHRMGPEPHQPVSAAQLAQEQADIDLLNRYN